MNINIYLEKLFEKYEVSTKDRFEIRQIFTFLSDTKKQNLLDNFWSLAIFLKISHSEMIKEQEILLWKIVSNIENEIQQIWKNILKSNVKQALSKVI